MTQKPETTTGKMKGGVRKRGKGGAWGFRLYFGKQPAQRCTQCDHREWLGPRRLEACPACGGELRDTKEPRRYDQGGFPTRKAAELARASMMTEYHGRGHAPELTATLTLAEYLRDVWLPKMEASGKLKATSKRSYRLAVERHIIGPTSRPYPVALVELRKLSPGQIAKHYARLREGTCYEGVLRNTHSRPLKDKAGKTRTGIVERPGLSTQSLRRVHAGLHRALAQAVKEGYLSVNPARGAADDIGDGDAEPRPLPAWSPDELSRFLEATCDSPWGSVWHVLANTGMRRGELAGLQLGDVDLEAATVTVRRNRVPVKGQGVIVTSAKTKRIRVIDLDPATVEVLRGVIWQGVSPADITGEPDPQRWLFLNDGAPLNPNTMSYEWRKAIKAAGARHIPLHGLRHTHATILLSAGVPVHIVAARLGHATPVITMTVYAHCLPRAQEAAVAVLAKLSSGASE
jgi:integrase